MLKFLSNFLLMFLIACIPLQGYAMQVRMSAHQEMQNHAVPQHGDMEMTHDCCPHDTSLSHDQPAPSLGGDCSHCPLCGVSLVPALLPPLVAPAAATQYPAPPHHVTRIYPEQLQRPPLSRHA